MRAAEILAEMLLTEAVYGVIFGPKIPKEGHWLTGPNLRGMVVKLATSLGAAERQSTTTFLATLISSGYTLVTNANGRIDVYGFTIPDMTEKALSILAVQGGTPVFHAKSLDRDQTVQQTTGAEAFGVALTPEEKERLRAKKADLKKVRTDLSPEEEEEFKAWSAQHAAATGNRASGLATLPGRPTLSGSTP